MHVLVLTVLVKSTYYWDNPLLGRPTVYLLSIVDSAALHLSVQGDAMETYIMVSRSFLWAIVRVGLGDRAAIFSDVVTQLMQDGALFCKMPCTIQYL